MGRFSHGTAATATEEAANPPSNVVEFRPRPSSLALHWCAHLEGGQMPAERRILQRVVKRCRFATAADERRYKVRAGDVFTHEAHRTIAADIGRHRTTVWRALKPYQEAGLLEVRQTRRRERVIVFRPPATAAATADAAAHRIHVRNPRTRSTLHCARHSEGGGGVTKPDEPPRVRRPDAPATLKQRQTIGAICQRRGLGEPWEIGGVEVSFTRRDASRWIADQDRHGRVRRVYHASEPPTEEQIDILADRGLLPGHYNRATAAAAIEGGLRGRAA